MKTPNLLTLEQVGRINPHLTVTQLMKIYNIHGVFDYALPHSFVVAMRDKTGFDPAGQMVWYYSRAEFLWGVPFPLTVECLEALREYAKDDDYIKEYLNKHWRC